MTSVADTGAAEAAAKENAAPRQRLDGLDLARALAILGMTLVHFALVMGAPDAARGWETKVMEFLDGRAAALFVVLAGVGVTLMGRSAEAKGTTREVKRTLAKRGVFLLVLGFINLTIWPGDILRVYGVTLLMAPWLLVRRSGTLWGVIATFVIGFIVLFLTIDYEKHWDWETMTYHELWTGRGLVRNLFYDGFRSVFPWTGLLVLGMWLGTLNLRDPRVTRNMIGAGLGIAVVAEVISVLLVRLSRPKLGQELAHALFGTESMPPLPIFLLSAIGVAVSVMGASLWAARRWQKGLMTALARTGRMALTWYLAHIVVGLGTVVALGWDGQYPIWKGFVAAGGFFAVALVISWIWMGAFKAGPMEWVMRKVAG